ncbi:MAG TPA: hypothetical protein VFI16_06970, partial [Anaeromyxobacteraceae bacterium]|nr:hypothetical protein [Anaeromyxobacteraceae bacterium]
ELIAGGDPEAPRFVYHAAAKLPLPSAERLVRESGERARMRAKEAIEAAVRDLRARGHRVVASGVVIGNRPLTSPLEAVLGAHNLIHAAEGELFRQAVIGASEACAVPVTCVRARELYQRGAKDFRVTEEVLRERLAEAGRAAGRPWALDQRESLLVALVALTARRS